MRTRRPAMDHVAIDLGSRESQICVRSSDGQVLKEDRVPTRSLGKYLARRAPSRVVLEACAEAFSVADAALAAGHEAIVVPASLAPSLGVGDRGIKTDVRDARNLSEASCRMSRLPSVHVPTQASRERKSICGVREALVQVRTKLVNTVRGWGRAQGLGTIRSGSVDTFPHRLREHVTERQGEVPVTNDGAWNWPDGIGTIRGGGGRDQTISRSAPAGVVSGADTRGKLELGTDATNRSDESRCAESPVGAGPVGVGSASVLQGRPDGRLVGRSREAEGQENRGDGTGAQIGGGVVRDVARRQRVRRASRDARSCGNPLNDTPRARVSASPREAQAASSRSKAANFQKKGYADAGCPEAVIALRSERPDRQLSAGDLVRSIATRQRISTPAALTAHSRLRQHAPEPPKPQPAHAGRKNRSRKTLLLTGQPLHSRCARARLADHIGPRRPTRAGPVRGVALTTRSYGG